jgi:hypothetical protein
MDSSFAMITMKSGITTIFGILLFLPAVGWAQNCCAPAVPQQGMLGETATLPHTLELGFHYELLRSRKLYDGSENIADPANTKSNCGIWHISPAQRQRYNPSYVEEKIDRFPDYRTASRKYSPGFG